MHRALRDLARRPSVFGITVTRAVFYGLYGPVEVALPVYVARVLHAGAGMLGGYWTLFGCGATVGALGASWIQRFGLWRVAASDPSVALLASGLAAVALAGIAAAVVLVRRAATSRPPGARRSTLPPPPASAEPSTRPP